MAGRRQELRRPQNTFAKGIFKEGNLSDLYETPPEVFGYWNHLFQFDIDVCAEPATAKCERYITAEQNALTQDWGPFGEPTKVWLNPPYSNPLPWIEKAIEQTEKGVFTLGLLPADTSTKWFHLLTTTPNVTLVYAKGRIRFLLGGERQGSPKFGSVFALFWPRKPKR